MPNLVYKASFLVGCMLFLLSRAPAQTVTTPGGSPNNIPKFSASTTIVNSAVTEQNGNLQIGPNSYVAGFTDPTNLANGGYVNFTGACCSIDGTHSGYGVWLNYNGFFNGNNWIQPRGDLSTYMFTSNFHAGGWAWYMNPPTNSSGSAITPVKVASLDGSGNLSFWRTNVFVGSNPDGYADGGYLNLTSTCCSIDATHSGYGAWLNWNGYFNGSNWIQIRGDLNSYMFTSNAHAGGWGWFMAPPSGCGGACAVTPSEVASIDASGNLVVKGSITSGGTVTAAGLKHARVDTSSCTFNGTVETCTITWSGGSFADMNYTAVCTPDGTNPTATALGIVSKTNSGIVVVFKGEIGSFSGTECMAMHD